MFCQCEHIKHFPDEAYKANIPLGHLYGRPTNPIEKEVVTIFGDYIVCEDCYKTCWNNGNHDFQKET